MRPSRLFAGIVAAQILFLAGWAASHEWTLRTGPTVLLETEPVDPRDILRGDYVILAYPIQRVPLDRFTPTLTAPPDPGTRIYVELRQEGDVHRLARASLAPLSPEPGNLVIRGRAAARWQTVGSKLVWVDYGIERFFVPEGKGNPRGKILAKVTVGRDGQPYLKGLLVDGRPYP